MIDGRRPVELSPMRRTIARRMSESKQKAPHFYVSTDIEMDSALGALGSWNAGRPADSRISVTAVLVHALALALIAHPELNAVWDGETLVRSAAINIGVAIEVPDGLLAPALLDCAAMDLEATASALRDLVVRTRAGKIRAAEWSEATFTLSNLGMFGITEFTAIIVPPQVAILATGRTAQRAVVREGQIVSRDLMTATLSADHRAIDGSTAARFLDGLRATLETMPFSLTAKDGEKDRRRSE